MICEYCGVTHDGSYGSGRFCSKKCASGFSSKEKRAEINKKVSKTISSKYVGDSNTYEQKALIYLQNLDNYQLDDIDDHCCSRCGKRFTSYRGLVRHIKIHDPVYENQRKQLKVRVKGNTGSLIDLDITEGELEQYRSLNNGCEICGRKFSHYQTVKGAKREMALAIDHDHQTNKFRGLLCVKCNRSLEWFLTHKNNIDYYLNR